MPRRKATTAAEFLAQRENDPSFQEMMCEQKKQRAEQAQLEDHDEKELVLECNKAGFSVKSVWDFINTEEKYEKALPILARHLEVPHRPKILNGIVRAIAVPQAWGIVSPKPLIRLFLEEKDPDSEIKWLLGMAISHTATLAEALEICELIENESHGSSREYLPWALIHCPSEAVVSYLTPYTQHPVLGKNASKVIKRVKRRRTKA